MSGTLINLIIQIIAGVIGGHAAGATLKNYRSGRLATRLREPSAVPWVASFFRNWSPLWRVQLAISTLGHSSVRSSAAALAALS